MRKLWKLVTAIGLCIVLMGTTLGTSAFAASSVKYTGRHYKQYTYLGDSIPFGYGLVSQEASSDPFSVGMRVKGTYTDLVSKALEKDNKTKIQPAASSGSRMCDYRIVLERGMGLEDPYDVQNDWYGKRKAYRTVVLRSMGPQIVNWVSKSDLITFQCGLNDLTASLVNAAYATGIVDLDKITNMESIGDVLDYIAFALNGLKNDPVFMDNFILTFQNEIKQTRENIRVVIKELAQIAPKDADILIVGYHKAVKGFRIIPGTDRSIVFDLIDEGLMSYNQYYKTIASRYDNVTFVDAPNASVVYPEGISLVNALTDDRGFLLGVHPDENGHKYIARKVLLKLNELHK
ncbi:MAG: SGNH/GDSL hydrolase family protein [Clostridia bacterium]|nr:SGNH/GDSL hydrolase family protein [Clostridia bacterium]